MLGIGLTAGLGATGFNNAQLGRRRPRLDNARRAANKLDQGFEKRIQQIAPGASPDVEIQWNAPNTELTGLDRLNDLRSVNKYASSTGPGEVPGIHMNPHADRVYLAHELGHLASQKTEVGNFIATLRHNPKLKNALLGAMLTTPVVASALEAGDDDMDSSIALAALASAPTIADEVLASKNGLAMMDTVGMRASLGQRGKLAGGLLSYLAAPLIAGAGGNAIGNLLDKEAVEV